MYNQRNGNGQQGQQGNGNYISNLAPAVPNAYYPQQQYQNGGGVGNWMLGGEEGWGGNTQQQGNQPAGSPPMPSNTPQPAQWQQIDVPRMGQPPPHTSQIGSTEWSEEGWQPTRHQPSQPLPIGPSNPTTNQGNPGGWNLQMKHVDHPPTQSPGNFQAISAPLLPVSPIMTGSGLLSSLPSEKQIVGGPNGGGPGGEAGKNTNRVKKQPEAPVMSEKKGNRIITKRPEDPKSGSSNREQGNRQSGHSGASNPNPQSGPRDDKYPDRRGRDDGKGGRGRRPIDDIGTYQDINEREKVGPGRLRVRCGPQLSDERLKELFSSCGTIKSLKRNEGRRPSSNFSGAVFVCMGSHEEAIHARDQLHGRVLCGTMCYVALMDGDSEVISKANNECFAIDRDWPPRSRLLVRAANKISDVELHDIFIGFGNIDHVAVLQSNSNHNARFSAFVKYDNAEDAEKAVIASETAGPNEPIGALEVKVAEPRARMDQPPRESQSKYQSGRYGGGHHGGQGRHGGYNGGRDNRGAGRSPKN